MQVRDMEDVDARVLDIQRTGSSELRNSLLSDLKDEAFKIASINCKKLGRELTGEEFSIALHALNEAIDRFDPRKNTSFKTFSSKVIVSRLIDFFRKENSRSEKEFIPFDNKNIAIISDRRAITEFKDKQHFEDIAQQRKEEILKFERIIGNLGYTWDDIIQNRPRHRDSIEKLHSIALHIVGQRLGERFLKENPCSRELKKLIGIGGRMLTKYRPYLCALIIAYAFDFPVMKNYLHSFRKDVQKNESL
jgi:RNA polymerase sigma factor